MLDARCPSSGSVSAPLNREWQTISADPATTAAVRSWGLGVDTADELLAAVGAAGGLPMEQADGLLAVLVAVARTNGLAARVVLQRVLPGLVTAAVRRTAGRPGERQGMFDDLVASSWEVIRTYPLGRRPTKIAVNVLRDAEYLTCVRPLRLRSSGELPAGTLAGAWGGVCGLDGRPPSGPDATDEVADVLALGEAGGVERRDLDLLTALYLDRRRVGEVAERFSVTTRTVRNRRVAALGRLACLARSAT
jgi:hypothetical protein